jgi:hypothetical protein
MKTGAGLQVIAIVISEPVVLVLLMGGINELSW